MIPVSRRMAISGMSSAALLPTLPHTARSAARLEKRPHIGINLAGAEFGPLLGQHGREYLYPEEKHFEACAQQGFMLVRLPFKWERLQPRLNDAFDAPELTRLRNAVAQGTSRGLAVVLDPHNYAKRRLPSDGWAQEYVIGSSEVPADAFASFWRRLAEVFASEPLVQFGLMNEPTTLAPAPWFEIAQRTLLAIRETGARNRVYVPGIAYTGAHSWSRVGNDILARLHDPGGDVVIEVHQYLDRDSSGTHAEAMSASIGSERLAQFQAWAKQHGLRAFLGEFGAARDELSQRALVDLLDEVTAHPEIWTGVAAWAGGPRWPADAMFNLEPEPDGTTRPQAAILSAFARGQPPMPNYRGTPPTVYLDRRRAELANAPGLAALCDADAVTMLLELNARDLLASAALLQSAGLTLIGTSAGAFHCGIAPSLRALPAAAGGSDPIRVRCALVIDRKSGRASLAATGGRPQTVSLLQRDHGDPSGPITLAPALTRLIVFPRAYPPDDLPDLVA